MSATVEDCDRCTTAGELADTDLGRLCGSCIEELHEPAAGLDAQPHDPIEALLAARDRAIAATAAKLAAAPNWEGRPS